MPVVRCIDKPFSQIISTSFFSSAMTEVEVCIIITVRLVTTDWAARFQGKYITEWWLAVCLLYRHQNGESFSRFTDLFHSCNPLNIEQSDGLYHSSSLLQKKHISQELSDLACLKHMDGVRAWWRKDEWKMLESPFLGLGMGNQAKLASWVTPAMVTFLLENVWARGMVARVMESAASQHWWVFTMVMFTVPFICPACYGRFLLFRPTGYSWSLPKFWAFPCKKQVEILRLSSLRTWPWNQPQSIARYKVKNLVCTDK